MSIATKNFGGSCVVPLGRFRLFENLPFSLVSRGIRKTRDVVTFDLKKKKKETWNERRVRDLRVSLIAN